MQYGGYNSANRGGSVYVVIGETDNRNDRVRKYDNACSCSGNGSADKLEIDKTQTGNGMHVIWCLLLFVTYGDYGIVLWRAV